MLIELVGDKQRELRARPIPYLADKVVKATAGAKLS
jgi:hypothetical protein